MAEVDYRSWELDPEEHSFFSNYFEVYDDFDILEHGLVDLHEKLPMVKKLDADVLELELEPE